MPNQATPNLTKIEQAAAWYQSQGYPTVYVRAIYVDPLTGKKDVQGAEPWQNATADMPVRRGQSQTSNAIGVRTGEISGVIFVDIDGTCPKWDALLAEHGTPNTWTVQTRTGGFHYGFKWDARMERFTKNDVGLAAHFDESGKKISAVDLRANGRIVFAPPTVCSDGTSYDLVNRTDPIPMPDWLFDWLCEMQDEKVAAKQARRAAPSNITPMTINESDGRLSLALGEIQAAVDGEKHDVLNRSSFTIGGLVAGGVIEMDRAVELIEEACRINGRYPFDGAQIATMHRALQDGTDSPIQGDAPFDELFAEVRNAPKADVAVIDGAQVIGGPIEWNLRIDQNQESDGSIDLATKIAALIPAYDDSRILTHFENIWWNWNGRHWRPAQEHSVFDSIARSLASVRIASVNDEGEIKTKPLKPGRGKISDVEDMLAVTLRRHVRDDEEELEPDRNNIAVPVRNGVVTSTPTGRTIAPPSPTTWSTAALPFDYNPNATAPRWTAWLKDTFQHDPDAISALQEWFGYFLVADPSWGQRMFWIIGPPRSGKGTIIKVAKALMGGAATGTNLTALGSDLAGKENLIGKSLAVIDDARDPDPRIAHRVSEFLLTATSGGVNVINRKYQTPWEGALSAVFLAASNTVPRFPDDGGAIATRFEIIKTRVSHLDDEDEELGNRLLTELPGILNWALDGLDRVRAQGAKFTKAAQAAAVKEGIARGATSATPLVKDHLIASPGTVVDGVILKALMAWWSSQQEDDYKPNKLSIANAVRAEFVDVEERQNGMTQDGRRKQGWRGIAVKCRECENAARRISPHSGPECNLHMTSEAQALLTR